MRIPSILVILLGIMGCQSRIHAGSVFYIYQIPAGAELTLHQAIRIAPQQAGRFIQNGKVLDYANVDVYAPNCKIEVNYVKDKWRKIEPDKFIITKVRRENELVRLEGLQLAGLLTVASGGATAEVYSTVFYLRSPKQSDVSKLSCQHWDDPTIGDDLGISEMKRTLGTIMSLNMAQ